MEQPAAQEPRKFDAFDLIGIGGSLAIAIAYRYFTGDTDTADRIGVALLLSWAALQSCRFLFRKPS